MKKLLLVLSIAIMLSGCGITDLGRGVVGAGMKRFGSESRAEHYFVMLNGHAFFYFFMLKCILWMKKIIL